jgi:hypothetical protein
MKWLLALAVVPVAAAVLVADATSAAAQKQESEICSLEDPVHCASCRALGSTVAKIDGSKNLAIGKDIDGAVWTPLFTAYFLNCQDVGRTLVKRGVDVNVGGRDGAMLVEIASQRIMNPDPKNAATNQAWAGIVEGGLIDLDARQLGGRSNRQAWMKARSTSRQLYPEIWARLERRSIPTPMQPDNEEFDPDLPSPATGKTRPAESAVSKGVEKFNKIFQQTGMAGVSAELSGCYRWSLQVAKPTARRVALEHCAAMDIVARHVDVAVTAKLGFPPTEFFEAERLEARVNQIRDQQFEGMIYPVYRRNLEVSVLLWLDFHYELMSTKDAPSSADSTNAQALVSEWQELNGQCRGGSGNEQKTMDACGRRERVGGQLSQSGYCYGQHGEYGYQAKWHVCGPNSIR